MQESSQGVLLFYLIIYGRYEQLLCMHSQRHFSGFNRIGQVFSLNTSVEAVDKIEKVCPTEPTIQIR